MSTRTKLDTLSLFPNEALKLLDEAGIKYNVKARGTQSSSTVVLEDAAQFDKAFRIGEDAWKKRMKG